MQLPMLRACALRMILCRGASAAAIALVASSAMAAEATIDFNVPAGPLASALTEIGNASSSTISFSPEVVQGLQSGAISGKMTARQAVARALAGTNLRSTVARGGISVVGAGKLVPTAGAGGVATDIADIDVSGLNANGSTDPLATEGTHSYATDQANIASKTNLSIRETPQTVSVLTKQQIEDRHVTSVTQAVDATPGLTTVTGGGQGNSNLDTTYQSRGYSINSVSIDGGTPIQFGSTGTGGLGAGGYTSYFRPIQDISEYDSLEVLRGAGGQYSGVGDPGGTLSLERKRPVDHQVFTLDQTFGSYSDYRTVLDYSSKSYLDGNLKVRSTFTNEDNHYFYKYAAKHVHQFYLNVELNVTPTTRVNFGGSYNDTTANPFTGGLPAFNGGALVDFPRDTCLCTPWGHTHIASQEYFLQATQTLPHDWSLHFNGTANKQSTTLNDLVGYAYSGLNPDYTGFSANQAVGGYTSDQYGLDSFITGKISPFGVLIEPTAGVSYSNIQQGQKFDPLAGYYSSNGPVIPFDPSQYPQMSGSSLSPQQFSQPAYSQQQLGGYASVRISPFSWAHLLVAERVSNYREHSLESNFGTVSDERYTETHVPPIPNMGLTFDIAKDTSIYGSYASIYQIVQAQTSPDGPFAPPITGSTLEGGIKRGFFNNRLQTSAAYYTSSEVNVPVLNPLYAAYTNAGNLNCCFLTDGSRSESSGVDFEASGKVTDNLDVALSYTYNNNQTISGPIAQAANQTLNFQFPKHIVKFFATLRPVVGIPEFDQYLRKTHVGLGVDYKSQQQYQGTTQTYDPISGTFGTENFLTTQKGYALFQLMARYDITEKTSLQLNAYNITDRKYYQTVGGFTGGNYYGTPRNFAGSLHMSF